jgi:hypothetical protein
MQSAARRRHLGEQDGYEHLAGQRLMQGATDIFLGWQRIKGIDGASRDYYVRQFHDWKGSADVDTMLSRTSPPPTPIRTNGTTKRSSLPSTQVGWSRKPACRRSAGRQIVGGRKGVLL